MSKPGKAYLILIGLFLITRCGNHIPDFERTKLKINGQKFEILTANELFENYLKDHNRFRDNNTASDKLIFNPLAKEILDGAEAPFMFNSVKVPYEPNDLLRKQIKLLKSEDIIGIIKQALYSITKSIPGPDTKIIILPASSFMRTYFDKYHIPGYGVAIGSGKIIIALDPTADNWKTFLSYGIAHEYHHSTWISRNWVSSDFSVIEYLVFEGRADAFAKSINDGIEVPAAKYLTNDQETLVWNLIKPDLFEKGHERINKVMFGNDDIPFGSGYTIGYHIVSSFKLNNPAISDFAMIDMEPKKILELSGYERHQNNKPLSE
ncbi:MAG: DUF2268 domain-containing putative Zn-dependent protease [Bacteroidia bacterium]|nr:DUF2268 domain-containing putative Zn-dependent protease [Bacteroidia bacterium]